jgi:UDP-N-acetylglucosamine--N-acetylmuramyl-(pentapeptide) pyrophosphoryl-undecaprenol N-acetylglucosamine transferase
MNAVIACGGTGGHLFPGIAVAEVLRDRGHEVMLLVSEKDIDALALSGRAAFQFEKLPTVGLPSPFSPAILGFIRRFCESLSLCRSIYRKFNRRLSLAWADLPLLRLCWLGGCAVFRPSFTNQMPSQGKRTN